MFEPQGNNGSSSPPRTRTDIQIRPYRTSDSKEVMALYMSFLEDVDSPFSLAMRSQRTTPLSLVAYSLGLIGVLLAFTSTTATLQYNGIALSLLGISLFSIPRYFLHSAFKDYVSRNLEGDFKDIAKHYGLEQEEGRPGSRLNGKSGFWVAEALGDGLKPEIVGCVGLDINTTPDQNVAELRRLVVSNNYRRRGIAQKLVQAVIHHAKETGTTSIFLTTSFYQVAAINMYKKLGFRVEKIREAPIKFQKISIYYFTLDVDDFKM